MSQSESNKFNCLVCGEEDNITQAIECSTCKSRYHKSCVVVNDNMLGWDCLKCKAKIPPPAPKSQRSKSVLSQSSSSSSQRLALKKLEEEKELLQRTIEEKLRLDREFLDKKYEILQQEGSRASGSLISSKEKVENWMNASEQATMTSTSPHILSSTAVDVAVVSTQANPSETLSPNIHLPQNEQNSSQQAQGVIEIVTTSHSKSTPVSIDNPGVPRRLVTQPITSMNAPIPSTSIANPPTCQAEYYHNTNLLPQVRYQQPYNPPICQADYTNPILVPQAQYQQASTQHAPNDITESKKTGSRLVTSYHEISKNALAARQVVPKELPVFSGKCSEWPEFIAAFEFTTEVCELSEYENAGRLQKCLTGMAFDAVRHTLYLPNGASNAISMLRRLFGQPEFVINELLTELRESIKPHQDNIESIIQFSLKIENLCAAMQKASLNDHLRNPLLLQEFMGYLPTNLKYEWAQHKYNLVSCNILDFMAWLKEKSNALLCILKTSPLQHSKEHINVHVDPTVKNNCIICNNNCNSVSVCSVFNNEKLSKRWELVKSKSLCRSCLKRHRGVCKNRQICEINGCQYYHNKLLHNYGNSGSAENQSNPNEANVNLHKEPDRKTFFKILPIKLSKNGRSLTTFAILDDCSSITLLEQSVSDALGLIGKNHPLHLKWTGETTRIEESSKLVCVEIAGKDSSKNFKLDRVRTVSSLGLPTQTQLTESLQQFSHLKGIPLPEFTDAVPQMLIGLSHAKLLSSTKIRMGKDNEPLASKTPLGWVVYGGVEMSTNRVLHISDIASNDILESEVKNYFSLECNGVLPTQTEILSAEETRAVELMQKTTVFKGSFYETGLLWKFDKVSLPFSYEMAKNRLLQLERRLSKEPNLAQVVNSQINEYIQKGYARILSNNEVNTFDDQSWYLPIFVVCNPNKPSKIRLVWDAAAKVNNISLNSMLLKGPDMLTSLPGILRRFREKRIAFTGDIKEMFHQVHIRKEDQQYQRFLWRFEQDAEPKILTMNVMTFGATCSPACANYVLNLNASRFKEFYPEAVRSIENNHYVDDLLECCNSKEEAINLARQIRQIHRDGGFEIRNWASNDEDFINALNGVNVAPNKNIELQTDSSIEKVLGLWWDTNSDAFTFRLKYNKANKSILNGSSIPSKRDVLRTLMSIFDPLGMLSHVLIYPKILLQDIWRAGLSWDEPIHDRFFKQWHSWLQSLPSIEKLSIPRFYGLRPNTTVQLHTFVDASEEAYACAIYARICFDGDTRCALIASKSKVAPLKPLSMPRLELQAALIGARMTASIKEEHNFKFTGEFYWSDSETVLSWLRSDARRYRQFVAIRIGEILELTTVSTWRWVPTKLNSADLATRKVIHNISHETSWFRGPDFLYEPENRWPTHKLKKLELEEIRTQYLEDTINFHMEVMVNFKDRSNWLRIKRSQAYVFRFIHNCKAKCGIIQQSTRSGPLIKIEYRSAENLLFSRSQHDGYAEEMACLLKNPPIQVPKTSSIYRDAPYVDEEGVLRSNSRLTAAKDLPEDLMKPIILPKRHEITDLILNYYHEKFHHVNSETAVNEIRQKFIIPSLRVLMRSVTKRCQYCKNKRAKPVTQFMANVPQARLGSFTRPFSFVGIDYFGPMLVRVKRTVEKRWGVILTCLTIRAVHIELASSLTTDSCVMCIQRFICRRGMPLEFYSDNGKNLKGASKELETALQSLNQLAFAEKFNSESCEWFFIPPSAPHMGGAWERLVRSIKITLHEIIPTKNPTEELLITMMHEVENIINSRPLTYVPLNSELEEALTPNHFLLGSSNGKKPMGQFSSDAWVHRTNWKRCEEYSNRIWKKWKTTYLPELRRRPTFNEHNPNLKVGDIVILCDDDKPKNHWPKAVVLATYPSKDGRVRKVSIKTAKGIYIRPASKLALLDVRQDISTTSCNVVVPGGTVNAGPT